MTVIVEGPDGGGKTSLIGMMAEVLDFEVMPKAAHSDHGPDVMTLRDWVDADLSGPVHNGKFYDRYPLISEPIYGPLIRGRMAEGFSDTSWMASRLNILRARDPFIIFCMPPKQAVLDNIALGHGNDTPHLRGVHQQGEAIYEAYTHRLALEMSLPFSHLWVWNYTEPNHFEDLVLTAKGYL